MVGIPCKGHRTDANSPAHEETGTLRHMRHRILQLPGCGGSVEIRLACFGADVGGLARRAALVRLHASPVLQKQQKGLAARFRDRLATTFEPELSVLDADAAEDLLNLLDLHASWDTWDRLRTWQGLSPDRARQLVSDLITRALAP